MMDLLPEVGGGGVGNEGISFSLMHLSRKYQI